MLRYVVLRILQAIVSLFVVALIVFFLSRITGDPIALMLPPEASDGDRAALRSQLGLDRPLPVQFLQFVSDLVRFDLGKSFRFDRDVTSLILERFPNSLLLAGCAIVFAALIGIPAGVIAARKPNSVIDRVCRTLAVSGQSIPTFVIGVVLILIFAVNLNILPSGGAGGPEHLVLPAISLGWFSAAAFVRMARSSTLEALSANYVTVAEAKGLSPNYILFRHALPNALTAILSLASVQFIVIASGAVITEAIFDWPGIGLLMVQGAFARDYAVVQGVVIFAAILTIVVNLVTDLLYMQLDPRIRLTQGS